MRQISLIPGVMSSVLGFGCAPILGAVGSKKAKRALDCAIDVGITHFDIARSYGYGEAERFVGQHLRAKRQRIVLASKFGIKANFKAKLLSPVKPLIRFGISMLKQNKEQSVPTNLSEYSPNKTDFFHYRIPITMKEMKKSLEESLKALNTDYLDYLFIHEPLYTIDHIDEVNDYAARLKQEGKIKGWGLAYMQQQKTLHKSYLNKFDVLQFNNSPGIKGYNEIVAERGQASNIFFAPLRSGNLEMKPAEKLLNLSIDFPKSVILCSMFKEEHLKANAELFNHKNTFRG
jgi:aryl-alcohol dehydrogenase-like predicted oxidoreductase